MSMENLSIPNQESDEDEDKKPPVDAYAAFRSLERWLFYTYPTVEEIIERSNPDRKEEIAFLILEVPIYNDDGEIVGYDIEHRHPQDASSDVDQSDDL